MEKFAHSVTLDTDLCKGCTNCVKRCPMEAIRVRDKKARIIKERCIDCGECIRLCPHHAKKAVVDSLEVLKNYDYTVALPAPTLYGQFKDLQDRNYLLTALKKIGFDDVFEVSVAAEAVSAATRKELAENNLKLPVISSACPTVLRIIRVRFPSLLPNLLEFHTPMEISARWARNIAAKKTGLPRDRIGCIFIAPCTAKVTSIKATLGTEKSEVDAVISISEVYPKLVSALKTIKEPENLARSGPLGVGWAVSGGECICTGNPNYLAADGMENVIHILEALEDEKLTKVDFIELNACVGGCVGGVLTVENPFIAKSRLNRLMGMAAPAIPMDDIPPIKSMVWDQSIEFDPVLRLDADVSTAITKLNRIKELEERFNGMDCGACGAPSCHALAEDIVGGWAQEDQCIFLIREKIQKLLNNGDDEAGKEPIE